MTREEKMDNAVFKAFALGAIMAALLAWAFWPAPAQACQRVDMKKFEQQVSADLREGRAAFERLHGKINDVDSGAKRPR